MYMPEKPRRSISRAISRVRRRRPGTATRLIAGNGKGIGDRTNGVGYSFLPRVQLPDERTGTVLVFKVFDRVSYALVVGASDSMHVGDKISSP